MSNRKIELSLETEKLTLGITEVETQLQSANRLITATCKLIELLNRSQISTKFILILFMLTPLAALYLYKQ